MLTAELDDLPNNNLLLVVPCLGLVLFLAALDQTIIATALPIIASKFNATPSEYSWVITSYQLAMTLLTPVNGRVSDIIGRKPILYAAIVVFTVFSALCGAAKSMKWLIIARAFQGLGGGSIIGMTSIVISDIVPLEKRGKYQGIMGASWGVAAVVGPLLGGALTDRVSWRWCFYINLPTCGVAFILLALTLKLNPTRKMTWPLFMRTFDFLGMALIMAGGACLIVGFSFAADYGFDRPSAYVLITVGGVLFFAGIANCIFTKRNAVIPTRAFKVRTTLFFMIASTLHAAAFIPTNVVLPQFFQGVHGADALQSGIQLLPYAIFVSWSTVVAGQIQSRLRIVRPVPWVGYAIGILGYGLMVAYFNWDIPLSRQYGLLIIPAVGVGLSLQSPLLILQAAMPLKDMAAVTSAWVLTRSLGGSIGISLYTSVFNVVLRQKFGALNPPYPPPITAEGYQAMNKLPDGQEKIDIHRAFADSFKPVWIIALGLLAVCLVITLPTKSYSLDRPRGAAAKAEAGVAATGAEGSPTEAIAEADGSIPIAEDGKVKAVIDENLPQDSEYVLKREEAAEKGEPELERFDEKVAPVGSYDEKKVNGL